MLPHEALHITRNPVSFLFSTLEHTHTHTYTRDAHNLLVNCPSDIVHPIPSLDFGLLEEKKNICKSIKREPLDSKAPVRLHPKAP